jgi:hypothetical protein
MDHRHVTRLSLIVLCACAHVATPRAPDRVALHIDTSEADAALAIAAGPRPPTPDAQRRLLATAGARRLQAREASMHRTLTDEALIAFVASPELAARAPALRDTLRRWTAADLDALAARVLPYLPDEARIVATVYPAIKPQPNSFVYFDDAGAAIFIYLDPAKTAAQFANTVAHELHHIGFASLRDEPCTAAPAVCSARTWSGAFGEGFAMLAAAGDPGLHPHASSPPDDRARWDRDVARFDADLRKVEALLRDIVDGRIDDGAAQQRAMEFFGIQGPWYTVGWTMAVTVEHCFGRATLVAAMRRPWTILGLYNRARAQCPAGMGTATATWDPDLVRALEAVDRR